MIYFKGVELYCNFKRNILSKKYSNLWRYFVIYWVQTIFITWNSSLSLLLSFFTVIDSWLLRMLHFKYYRFQCILVFMISIVAELDAIAESRLSKGISNLKKGQHGYLKSNSIILLKYPNHWYQTIFRYLLGWNKESRRGRHWLWRSM